MAQGSYQQFCPVAMAAEVLCTRWTIVLLRELIAGSTRFNELRRGVPRMSPALLSQRLKELEAAGVLKREPSSLDAAVSEYRLTAAGRELAPLVEASEDPKEPWLQMLMASYFEADKPAEAVTMAERLATRNPTDKRAQMNLAAAYLQGEKYDQAATVMEKLRASGQLTEAKDYRQLYSVYLSSEGKERQAIAVIEEGLQKNLLQPDAETYTMLAQSYYFSDQVGKAIEAYGKAAPLAATGETYLNLARLLWQEDRIAEAKDAARKAQAKGVKDDKDVKRILAL